MDKLTLLIIGIMIFGVSRIMAQQGPWQNPLKIAWSTDGKTFDMPLTFQDSAGVPSVVRWRGDTLVCAFQWFRKPDNGPSWDRIAVKFSYNSGQTWTDPVTVNFSNYPTNFIRAFDPALFVYGDLSLRMYFSAKPGPFSTMDSLIDTYMATSWDGVNFSFNSGAVFGHPTKPVIDPSVILFKNKIRLTAPAGAPQDGAYHGESEPNDGTNFVMLQLYPSDNQHNWTGNYCRVNQDTLRFYGISTNNPNQKNIWFKTSTDGATWPGNYEYTNIDGGDNSVLRISPNSWLMIFVGKPETSTSVSMETQPTKTVLFPVPTKEVLHISSNKKWETFSLHHSSGKEILSGLYTGKIDVHQLSSGVYILQLESGENRIETHRVIISR